MTYGELESAIWAILADATFETDNDGQIIIYTGLKDSPRGHLVEWET